MKRITTLIVSILALSFATWSQTAPKVGSPAPQFSLTAIDGTCSDLAELRGSVVVLTFWSTRCEICRHELPKLNQVADRFAGRDVVFLSLTMEDESKVSAYLQKNRLASRVLPNSFGVVLQYADRSIDGSLDMGFPAFYVIDKQGLVQYRANGFNKTPALAAAIDRLVSK